MARGKSGRIVLEVDPYLKRNLYLSLETNQKTLKEWFIEAAESYISNNKQMKLFAAERKAEYKADTKK